MRRSTLLSLMFVVWPAVAHGQSWLEAYHKGDYAVAADLLHAIVSHPDAITTIDPASAQHLAWMYSQGLGIPRDAVMACALAQFAESRAHGGVDLTGALTARAAEIVSKHCASLTREERIEASHQMGCLTFGLEPHVIELGGRQVQVSARGLALVEYPAAMQSSLQCMVSQVARVRATTVEPPANALPNVGPRHFIEIFGWARMMKDGAEQRGLLWHVYELRAKTIEPVLMHMVLRTANQAWARPAMPPDVESELTFEMIRSGHVRWRLAGAKPRHGWLLLPQKEGER